MRKLYIIVCIIFLTISFDSIVYAEEMRSLNTGEEKIDVQENRDEINTDTSSYEQGSEQILDNQELNNNESAMPEEVTTEPGGEPENLDQENLEQESNAGNLEQGNPGQENNLESDGSAESDEETAVIIDTESSQADEDILEEKIQMNPESSENPANGLDTYVEKVDQTEKNNQSLTENILPETKEAIPSALSLEAAEAKASESKEKAFVREVYSVLLERSADVSGLKLYSDNLRDGTHTVGSLVKAITESKEFSNKKYSNETYVGKLYQILLGRTGRNNEVQWWTEKLDRGVSRQYILNQILNSAECTEYFQKYGLKKGAVTLTENRDKNPDVTAFVFRCYRYILERNADIQGLNTWTGKILSGASGAEIVEDLIYSPEFLNKNKSFDDFIDILYEAMMGRPADTEGREYWGRRLDRGVSYRYIINGFAASGEFKNLCNSYGITSGKLELSEARDKNIEITGFVTRLYQRTLERQADISGLNYWCDLLLNQAVTPAKAAYGFVFSNEVGEKKLNDENFLEMLYAACLGRGSDAAGKKYWLNYLRNGTSREDIFWAFVNSQEFQSIVAGYGLAGENYTGIGTTEDGLWYVVNGRIAYDFTGIVTWNGRRYYVENGKATLIEGIFTVNSCKATSYNGSSLTVSIQAGRNSALEAMGGTFGLALLDSSGMNVLSWSQGSVTKSGVLTVSASFTSGDSFRTAALGKYAIAVKNGSSVVVISEAKYLSNPDIFASKEEAFKDKYMGYYEGYKITSKKGIQGVSMSYTEDLRVQHILLNVDIADMVSTSPAAGYVSYVYKGQSYYFQDLIALKDTIYDLHGWGSTDGNAYGENHTRAVTLNLLLSWDDSLSYLIHPSARSKGAASYYALNMTEERARNTFEALFCYMGEELGQYKERVTNWTLGNEINSCQAWNYSGSMSLEECVENYAEAFQLLYQGVKRTAGSSRIFISLDHCWTAADAGHSGKAYLDAFAAYMNKTAPSMQWNVNYHPYSQPLNRNDFWNDYSNTTDSADTRYISMRNIQVLTDYLGTLETQYGKESGSTRVIIGELGFSATGGDSGQENQQAAALGYGYYKAMFNTRIDAYIIRAYLDDPAESGAGLHLGLRRNDSSQTAKISYDVYRNLDTDQSLTYMNQYLGLIGIGSWESVIGGFDASKLPASDF